MSEITTLAEYATIQGGYAYKSTDFLKTGKFKVLKIKNIRFGYIDYSETDFISDQLSKKTEEWKTKPKDILISMTGSGPNAPASLVGRVARVGENEPISFINQRIGRVIVNEKVDSDYIYYLLSQKSSQEYFVNNSTGSANQVNINGNTILSLEVPCISFEESKKIAQILNAFDDKIQLNTQINQTLEQIAQALFKSWFVDFDPVRAKVQALSDGLSLEQAELAAMQAISGKTPEELTVLSQTQPDRYAELAETAKAFPCEMVEIDGVEVPKEWTFQYLKDVCNIVYGKGLPKTKLTNTGYRVFGANGVIGYYSEFMYKNPQILIGCRGTVGQVTVSTPFSFITNNSLIIEYENSLINRYYLEHYLRTLNLKEISSGSVQPQITIQNMSGVKLLTPNRETLLLYEINVKDIYETMYQNQIENEKLTKVRDLLLPKLLNGEIE
jgi:putative type I restriction system specificity protein